MGLFRTKAKSTGRVGVSIGSEKLSLALIEQRDGKPYLTHCESNDLQSPKEAKELLAKRVKALEWGNFPCNFVLNSRDYSLHLVEAPAVESSELRAAVRWKIKDLLDMKVNDAVIDVFPVPDDAYRGRQDMLYVVAALKSRIKNIVDAITYSGLELSVIDIPELAMNNLSNQYLEDERGLAFVDLRKTGSTMNITRNGDIYLTRRINTQVAPDAMSLPDWPTMKDRLVLEIQRSLDYYESQMGQPQVTRIVIAPRILDIEAMTTSLNEALTTQVTYLDLKQQLGSNVVLTPQLQQICMNAIGTALRGLTSEQKAKAA